MRILEDAKQGGVYASDMRDILVKEGIIKEPVKEPVQSTQKTQTTITADELVSLLKVFSQEIIAAVGKEMAKVSMPVINTTRVNTTKCSVSQTRNGRGGFVKLQNPQNWDEIIHMYNSGISLARLARQIGWHENTVRSHLIDSGVTIRSSDNTKQLPDNWVQLVEKYRSGELTVASIAKTLGWHKATVSRYIHKALSDRQCSVIPATQRKTLPDNWEQLVEQYRSGVLTMVDIAAALGWNTNTVSKYIRQTIGPSYSSVSKRRMTA